jgi:GATA-binding protein
VSLQQMSGAAAKLEERGGLLHPIHALSPDDSLNDSLIQDNNSAPNYSGESLSLLNPPPSSRSPTTEHDFRFPRRPADHLEDFNFSDAADFQFDTGSGRLGSRANNLDKLDLSGGNSVRKELLRDSFFPTWKDDAAGEELDSPDEMQKKDPLATQIWKLYSKTKKQLPNQERMENLTWRMMAMNLRKRKQEEAARYALRNIVYAGSTSMG